MCVDLCGWTDNGQRRNRGYLCVWMCMSVCVSLCVRVFVLWGMFASTIAFCPLVIMWAQSLSAHRSMIMRFVALCVWLHAINNFILNPHNCDITVFFLQTGYTDLRFCWAVSCCLLLFVVEATKCVFWIISQNVKVGWIMHIEYQGLVARSLNLQPSSLFTLL